MICFIIIFLSIVAAYEKTVGFEKPILGVVVVVIVSFVIGIVLHSYAKSKVIDENYLRKMYIKTYLSLSEDKDEILSNTNILENWLESKLNLDIQKLSINEESVENSTSKNYIVKVKYEESIRYRIPWVRYEFEFSILANDDKNLWMREKDY